VQVLMGPAVLLLGSALVMGSLFLPWYHADPRIDHYPPDLQPFVPMQPFVPGDLFWLVVPAIHIIAVLVCLVIDVTPLVRRPRLIREAAVLFFLLMVMAGGTGILFLMQVPGFFLTVAGTVPKVLDGGYFVALAGCILLLPGAVLLINGWPSWARRENYRESA
jgi:hypothetical protein